MDAILIYSKKITDQIILLVGYFYNLIVTHIVKVISYY